MLQCDHDVCAPFAPFEAALAGIAATLVDALLVEVWSVLCAHTPPASAAFLHHRPGHGIPSAALQDIGAHLTGLRTGTIGGADQTYRVFQSGDGHMAAGAVHPNGTVSLYPEVLRTALRIHHNDHHDALAQGLDRLWRVRAQRAPVDLGGPDGGTPGPNPDHVVAPWKPTRRPIADWGRAIDAVHQMAALQLESLHAQGRLNLPAHYALRSIGGAIARDGTGQITTTPPRMEVVASQHTATLLLSPTHPFCQQAARILAGLPGGRIPTLHLCHDPLEAAPAGRAFLQPAIRGIHIARPTRPVVSAHRWLAATQSWAAAAVLAP